MTETVAPADDAGAPTPPPARLATEEGRSRRPAGRPARSAVGVAFGRDRRVDRRSRQVHPAGVLNAAAPLQGPLQGVHRRVARYTRRSGRHRRPVVADRALQRQCAHPSLPGRGGRRAHPREVQDRAAARDAQAHCAGDPRTPAAPDEPVSVSVAPGPRVNARPLNLPAALSGRSVEPLKRPRHSAPQPVLRLDSPGEE